MGNKATRAKQLKNAKDTRWLDLSDQKLKTIPVEVSQLQPVGVSLSLNPISLTDDLGQKLALVEFLDLSCCNLITLNKSIINLTRLKELVVARNSLSTLPLLPESLEKLDVSNNMLLQVPEQLHQLPHLYYVNLEGNPCERRAVTLKGRAKTGKILGKELTFDRMRFNSDELETLSQLFQQLATPAPTNPDNYIIEEAAFQKRLGLAHVTDTTFVQSFYRAFTKHVTQLKREEEDLDVRAFLLALGIIFKGTVEEKLKFAFAMYDLNEDGVIELSDIVTVTKSSLISSVFIAQSCHEEYESDENVRIKTTEVEVALHVNNRSLGDVRVNVGTAVEGIVQHVMRSQWPFLKELITKRFREMEKLTASADGKVDYRIFSRYWFSMFGEVNEFLHFYGSLLRYGFVK